MGSKSDYLEAAILNEVFGATAFSAPATLYFGLFTATPSDSGGGTECTGGSYARKAMTNNGTNFGAATGTAPTTKTNATAITFVTATADWGTVVAWGVFDAVTAGNLLYWGAVSPSAAVGNGATASFAIGALTITED